MSKELRTPSLLLKILTSILVAIPLASFPAYAITTDTLKGAGNTMDSIGSNLPAIVVMSALLGIGSLAGAFLTIDKLFALVFVRRSELAAEIEKVASKNCAAKGCTSHAEVETIVAAKISDHHKLLELMIDGVGARAESIRTEVIAEVRSLDKKMDQYNTSVEKLVQALAPAKRTH